MITANDFLSDSCIENGCYTCYYHLNRSVPCPCDWKKAPDYLLKDITKRVLVSQELRDRAQRLLNQEAEKPDPMVAFYSEHIKERFERRD